MRVAEVILTPRCAFVWIMSKNGVVMYSYKETYGWINFEEDSEFSFGQEYDDV